MSSPLKLPIQILFRLTSKNRALNQTKEFAEEYNLLTTRAGAKGSTPHNVPKMIGVDEDMRDWSLFQLLEHNTIVNRAITDLICTLAEGVDPNEITRIDPKKDVMPSPNSGPEQVAAFDASIQDHLSRVGALSDLRKTESYPHPYFGNFTAHQWTCMFSFHLKIHLRQARLLAADPE